MANAPSVTAAGKEINTSIGVSGGTMMALSRSIQRIENAVSTGRTGATARASISTK